jgi:hypothetical protein
MVDAFIDILSLRYSIETLPHVGLTGRKAKWRARGHRPEDILCAPAMETDKGPDI